MKSGKRMYVVQAGAGGDRTPSRQRMKREAVAIRIGGWRALSGTGLLGLLLVGCVSVGREFPTPTAEMITNGVSTQAELRQLFGPPVQEGIEDGDRTWTWVLFKSGLGGQTVSKQFHVKFNERGIVKSYAFTSSLPEDLTQKTK